MGVDNVIACYQDTGMNTTTLSRDIKASALVPADSCWSCGDATTRPDGLCKPCSTIDGDAIPDMTDQNWKGNTKPFEAIFVAPPNARAVR